MDTVTTAPEKFKKIPKAKHWVGTLNNYTPADEACFLSKIEPLADYYVYGKEVGEQGTPHLQFMISFKAQKALTGCIKLFVNKAHWEVKSQKSTMQEASDYCKKVCVFNSVLFLLCLSHSFLYIFIVN